MPDDVPTVSYADVAACDWQGCIAASVKKDCSHYYTIFSGKLAESQRQSNDAQVRGWLFLTKLTSPYPRYDDAESPYGPMMTMADGRRTATPEDFTDEEGEILRQLLAEVNDEEFKARINDFLWIIKKDYRAAIQAAAAFIKSAEALRNNAFDDWTSWTDRLERAGQLSRKVNNAKLTSEVISTVESLIASVEASATDFLPLHLMAMLFQLGAGNPKKYAAVCGQIAARVEAAGDLYTAEQYHRMRATWLGKDGDANEARNAKLQAAEAIVKRAESFLSAPTPSYFGASGMLATAIEAFRQAKGPSVRIDELRQRLREYQEKSTAEMSVVSSAAVDISKLQNH